MRIAILVIALLSAAVLAPVGRGEVREARADYQCYAYVCGETWRNNWASWCIIVGYAGCYQGTWSATYSGTAYKLRIIENRQIYELCAPTIPCWGLYYATFTSSVNQTALYTNGANYHYQKKHRTEAFHSELSTGCDCGGSSQDGF